MIVETAAIPPSASRGKHRDREAVHGDDVRSEIAEAATVQALAGHRAQFFSFSATFSQLPCLGM
jgi:hypothetical protein